MCPIKPVFSSLRLSSGAKSNIQQILWIQQMFVTLVFEAGLCICNCILCTHKPYVAMCDSIWHQSIKHSDIYQSGFMARRLFGDSFTVLVYLRVTWPLKRHSTCSTVSFWSFFFVLPELSCVAPKLLISLGPHNGVLFCDWGKHNRITPYNVGGFVCQEQEANYVDMLLLTSGYTFITHTLQLQWKPLTNPLFFRFQERQRRGNPVT